MSERYFEPSAMYSYFEKQDKPTVFFVSGKEVIVDDERLATALSRLPELRRECLLHDRGRFSLDLSALQRR